MDVIEVNVHYEAGGVAWQGVGYYPNYRDLQLIYRQAEMISEAIREHLDGVDALDVQSIEIYRGRYVPCSQHATHVVSSFLRRHVYEGDYSLCWTVVQCHNKEGD